MRIMLTALIAAVLLCGCAVVETVGQSELAVRYATAKVIDGKPEAAARVVVVADEILALAEAEDAKARVTVSLLDEAVRRRIDWRRYDLADQQVIDALLMALRIELERRIGAGVIDGDKLIELAAVISWVRQTALMAQR